MTIRKTLISEFHELENNTIIIENPNDLNLEIVKNGILIVFASWSGTAITNCILTIKLLYEKRFRGHIMIIDIDSLSPDFQIDKLGDRCHGNGEIFTVFEGVIDKKYVGKESFINFKRDFN